MPGAGWGRELVALRVSRYEVVGFDPVAAPAGVGGPGVGRVHVADYRTFVDAVRGGGPAGPLAEVCREPFDAVLLGWGSLTHVFSRAQRREVFEAASIVAPRGPILASFWQRPQGEMPRRSERRRRFFELSQRLGRLRGVEAAEDTDFVFGPSHGFGIYLSTAELEAIARSLDRPIDTARRPFPRATLGPPAAEARG